MSLDGQYDASNIFARIVRGELPAYKIYEDADVIAFMDLFPQSRGHCLVISRTSQARNFLELEPDRIPVLMSAVQSIARAVNRALTPDGIIITQFNGAPAGQTVFHLHFHIIPRYEGVALAGHGHSGMADGAELTALAAQIAAEIGV